MRITLNAAILLALSGLCTAGRGASPENSFPNVEGWKFTPWEKTYTRENLWDIIDGAADLYLSYGFTDLHIGSYENGAGVGVRVEVYKHDSRANAFGIYSQERNPDYHFVDVGTQGYIEDGVLNFLCGRYYVKISSRTEGEKGRDAMMLIARRVERHLGEEREFPAELSLLPPEGRQVNSERFVSQNFLGYSFLHSAYVAEFRAGSSFTMFIIDAGTEDQAKGMVLSYVNVSGQAHTSADEGIHRVSDPFNGDVYLLPSGRFLSGVYNCADPQLAQHQLQAVASRLANMLKY